MSTLRGPALDAALSPTDGVAALAAPGDGIASRNGLQVSVTRLFSVRESTTNPLASPSVAGGPGYAVAVAYDRNNRLLVEMRSPHQLLVFDPWSNRLLSLGLGRREEDAGREPFLGDAVADTGRDLFHASTASGLTCVTCHPEGGDDGRVWDFERIGRRRTPSLRGGIVATAPFHWGGDLGSFGTLTHEVFTRRMGGGAVRDDQIGALSAWVDGLPPLPAPAPTDAARVARGEALFRSPEVGCAACHGGNRLTNNQTVDVGTGGSFQVPSLMGLAARAPYMHAGCAATLRQRFTDTACGGGDRHGHTSQLSGAQVDDLTAWLDTR